MQPFFELPVNVRHEIYKHAVKLDRPVRAHELHAYIRNRHWLRSSILNVHPMVRVDAFQTFILKNTFDILDIQDHAMGPAFFDFEQGQKQYHPQLLFYVEKYINDNRLVGASLMQLRKATLRVEKRGGTFTFVGPELLVFIPGIQQLTLDFTRDPKYDVGLYMDCDESELMKIGEHPNPHALFSPSLRKIIVLVDGDESGPEQRDVLVTAWASVLETQLEAEGLRKLSKQKSARSGRGDSYARTELRRSKLSARTNSVGPPDSRLSQAQRVLCRSKARNLARCSQTESFVKRAGGTYPIQSNLFTQKHILPFIDPSKPSGSMPINIRSRSTKAATESTATQGFSIMSLPTELRHKIYSHIFFRSNAIGFTHLSLYIKGTMLADPPECNVLDCEPELRIDAFLPYVQSKVFDFGDISDGRLVIPGYAGSTALLHRIKTYIDMHRLNFDFLKNVRTAQIKVRRRYRETEWMGLDLVESCVGLKTLIIDLMPSGGTIRHLRRPPQSPRPQCYLDTTIADMKISSTVKEIVVRWKLDTKDHYWDAALANDQKWLAKLRRKMQDQGFSGSIDVVRADDWDYEIPVHDQLRSSMTYHRS